MSEKKKNPVGRPPIYKTIKALQEKIDEYFESGHKKRQVVVGKPPKTKIIEVPILTITGLARFLGFCSRQSFYDLEDVKKFSYTIKRARLFIEEEYEEQLQLGNTTGAIFCFTGNRQISHFISFNNRIDWHYRLSIVQSSVSYSIIK